MRRLLSPLSYVFGAGVFLRDQAFRGGLLKSEKISRPVISVGNLSVGGTGKTPFVLALIEQLQNQSYKAGVVSRGYGADYGALAEVPQNPVGMHFGDEPALMKLRYPRVPVFLSAQRSEAARALLESYEVDLLIADDAFQHRYLRRDLDIVLLDATQEPKDYRLLPWGLLREPFTALARADWVVVTKLNLLPEKDREERENFLRSRIPSSVKVLRADMESSGLYTAEGEKIEASSLKGLFLLSGIGRPEAFERSVERFAGRKVDEHWRFKDHHCFSREELREIFSRLPGGERLITTEKDFIRLRDFTEERERFLMLKVDMKLKGEVDEFWAQVLRLVR
jgi:tetraacyldisaccharide 4'-kinase